MTEAPYSIVRVLATPETKSEVTDIGYCRLPESEFNLLPFRNDIESGHIFGQMYKDRLISDRLFVLEARYGTTEVKWYEHTIKFW
jgi:hypothetical protein